MQRYTVVIEDKKGNVTVHPTYGESPDIVLSLWAYWGQNKVNEAACPFPYTVIVLYDRRGN